MKMNILKNCVLFVCARYKQTIAVYINTSNHYKHYIEQDSDPNHAK